MPYLRIRTDIQAHVFNLAKIDAATWDALEGDLVLFYDGEHSPRIRLETQAGRKLLLKLEEFFGENWTTVDLRTGSLRLGFNNDSFASASSAEGGTAVNLRFRGKYFSVIDGNPYEAVNTIYEALPREDYENP